MPEPKHTSLPEALYALQEEVGLIPRDADNPFFKSKFSSFPSIKTLVDPLAWKHGLLVWQTVAGESEIRNRLFFNGDVADDATVTMHLQVDNPQGVGSAISYYRRYLYTTCLGLVSAADEDDGNAASAPPKAAQGPQKAPQATQRPSPLHSHTEHVTEHVQEDF